MNKSTNKSAIGVKAGQLLKVARGWHQTAIRTTIATWVLLLAAAAQAEVPLNFKPFFTEIGEELLSLHNFLMIFIVIIFVGVFYFMFHSLIVHRKSKGHEPAQFHESVTVEIIWTAIPFLILVIMAVPTTASLIKMRDNNNADLIVKVTGYQFKWGYEYMEGSAKGLKFFSNLATTQEQINNESEKDENYLLEVDNPLVLPVGKKTKLLFTSNDVLHAFWVPQLAIQQTGVPGYIREFSITPHTVGTYRGQCSELCGSGHPFMPIVINVVPADEFDNWAQDKIANMPRFDVAKIYGKGELETIGDRVYKGLCIACHQAGGVGIAGAFPPLANSEMVTGDTEALLDVIVNGKPGTAMAAFGKQISDVEVAAVATFLRNSFGNSTGDAIQPKEVTAIRSK